jgi:hypothetical protein
MKNRSPSSRVETGAADNSNRSETKPAGNIVVSIVSTLTVNGRIETNVQNTQQ